MSRSLSAVFALLIGAHFALAGVSAHARIRTLDGEESARRLAYLIEAVADPTVSPKSRAWILAEIEKIFKDPRAPMTERQVQFFRQKLGKEVATANAHWEKQQNEQACPASELPATQSEEDVIKVDTELVMATVRAWSRTSDSINDLRAEELKLFVNGNPIEVDALDRGAISYEVVLLMDFSGSMLSMHAEMAAAAKDFARKLKASDRMAVLAFGNQVVDVTRGFLSDPAAIERSILNFDPKSTGGGSSITDALAQVLEANSGSSSLPSLRKGPARDVVRVVIQLTDGEDTAAVNPDLLSRLAAESAALIYPVGFGVTIRNRMLEDAATRSGGVVLEARNSNELAQAYAKIQHDLANLYRVSFQPLVSCPSRPLPAQCSIKIRALRPEVVLRGRTEYPCHLLKGTP